MQDRAPIALKKKVRRAHKEMLRLKLKKISSWLKRAFLAGLAL
jgi:hypothetical protein